MSEPFTFKATSDGWVVKSTSTTLGAGIATIVGREIHVEDFPHDIPVVGHVIFGNRWIVVLKPAQRREFLGLVVERSEYIEADPFLALASLSPGGEEAAAAITAAGSLDQATRAALAPPLTRPQDMFVLAGLSDYLPLAYAAFSGASAAERRSAYWSYLPTRFQLTAFPLARFGDLGTRRWQHPGAAAPSIAAAPAPAAPVAPIPTAPDISDHLARLEKVERLVKELATPAASPTPPATIDTGRYDSRMTGLDDAMRDIVSRLDSFQVRLDTLPTATGSAEVALKSGEQPSATAEVPVAPGSAGQAAKVVGAKAGPAAGTTSAGKDKLRLPAWAMPALVAVIASVATAGLLTFLTRQDVSGDVKAAETAKTEAEAARQGAKAALNAIINDQQPVVAAALANATQAASDAETARGLAVAASNEAASAGATSITAIGTAQTGAIDALTKKTDALVACLRNVGKAQADLIEALTDKAGANTTKRLEAALKLADDNCPPKS